MEKNFERASKLKLRYATKAGKISTEDLWDLPLESKKGVSLDNLARSLNKALKENAEESFVVQKTKVNSELELAFNIVKYVIDYKMAMADRAAKAAVTKARKEKLLAAKSRLEGAELDGKSMAEIDAELAEMDTA